MERRIIELEKKAAFQEHEIKELSQALMQHHKEIEALKTIVSLMKDKNESGSLVKDLDQEDLPPHY
ncbi:MAG: SlyX family protein [Candidatus Omnitrophica bacterium]|nr:SlyX family protein [Candidatus Omnitrophota bacterium]